MLSPAQIAQREGKLTASAVGCLMSGDEEKILNLWRELTGDPSYVPEDLNDVWVAVLGSHTESLQLDWYEKKTGQQVTRRGEVVLHPEIEWAACTLDGWADYTPIETKHCGGYESMDTIRARYMPQMHWQMIVTGARQCILSVIMGNQEPKVEIVDYDEEYGAELLRRAEQFMECVRDLRPPVALASVAAPIKAEKSYSFEANNHWCSEAFAWIANKQAARDFATAEKTIKSLVPADASVVTGGGISCRRNKAGSLTIREKL